MTTTELQRVSPGTEFEGKKLECDSPIYVATAAESLLNLDLDPITATFLRTGIIQDSRVVDESVGDNGTAESYVNEHGDPSEPIV